MLNILNMPDVKTTDSIIDSYDKSKLPALNFTRQIMNNNPKLMGSNIQSVLYVLFCGLDYSSENLFNSFKTYLQTKYVNSGNTFESDTSFIIQYAKVLQSSENIINFEPVFEDLISITKTWCNNDIVTYNGKTYEARYFKPLCYTVNGEQIFTLLPYICFIVTFLLNSHPFRFMSTYYETQGFTFLSLFNNHLMKGYQNLAKDLNINIGSKGLSALSNIDDKYFIDMFTQILAPEVIVKLRNEYMQQSEDLLNTCLREQHSITKDVLQHAYNNNMDSLFSLIFKHNIYKRFIDKFPEWSSDKEINSHELILWTEYKLAGGDKPFALLDDQITIVNKASNDYDFSLVTELGDKPSIYSNIKPVTTYVKQQPFSSNDLILRIISSYILKEFNNLQDDIFEGEAFKFDETVLRDGCDIISNELSNLWLYGKFIKYGQTINNLFKALISQENFRNELIDIKHLSNVCQEIYPNKLGNCLITAFILGLTDEIVLNKCLNSESLENFSLVNNLANIDIKKHDREINKLADMIVSLTMLITPNYITFVNTTVNRCIEEITACDYIFMPYIKGLADLADIYAIGGCELYDYAKLSNPFVRAYAWYTSVYGINDNVYKVYKYLSTFKNGDLFELLEEYKNNEAELIGVIKIHISKMFNKKELPKLLTNYIFNSDSTYTLISDSTIYDNQVIKDLAKLIFMKSSAAQTTEKHIHFKRIKTDKLRKLYTEAGTVDYIMIDNHKYPVSLDNISNTVNIPVYDLNSAIESTGVSIMTPGGYNLYWIDLFGNKTLHNNTILMISNTPVKTRFQKYDINTDDKVRMTKMKNTALTKRQNTMIKSNIQSAINLAEQGLN